MNKYMINLRSINSLDNLKKIIGTLPYDYQEKKELMLNTLISRFNKPDPSIFSDNFNEQLDHFPKNDKEWKRKHVFLIVFELMTRFKEDEKIMDFLGNVSDRIVGDCLIGCVTKYPGEPNNEDSFYLYIRDMNWL